MPAYWPFPSFPLSPFSRSSSTNTPSPQTGHISFPFPFPSPPALSTSATPSHDGDASSRGPLTPAQVVELEEHDLYFVDRALMDFAAGREEDAWVTRERDVRVKALWVHPIKSCRGVSLTKSMITPQGLQYDRQWAIRETQTSQMCTAREYPSMVLITPEIDEERNLLVVRFPEGTGLPGFAVRLHVDEAEMRCWPKVGSTIMHKKPLPPSYIPTYTPIPGTPVDQTTAFPSPSDQLTTYLGRPVEFIQKSPFLEDVRRVVAPPVPPASGVRKEWLTEGDLEYGVDQRGGRGVETGYADGFPVLLANEESFAHVQSSLAASLDPSPDSTFTNIGPTFNKSLWQDKTLDLRRFRANIIVGRGPAGLGDAEDELGAWDEERWRHVEFWGRAGDTVDVVSNGDTETQDVEMIPLDGGKAQAATGTMVKRGGMICVSRCGRCQLPNVDPDNGDADKAVPYKILAKYRRVDPAQKFTPIFGVNAVPQQARAVVHVGDRVRVRGMNDWEVVGR